MYKIKNLTGKEKIYFSADAVQHEYTIEGVIDGHYGKLYFGKSEKYMFVAFGSYVEWCSGGLYRGLTSHLKGTIYKFQIVDKKTGNEIYKKALQQKERVNKKGRKYRILNDLTDYFK